MAGILYVVATPIGNLEDITFRAINTLKNVDVIAAEDTRHTLKLLNHFEISKPLISYYKEKENEKSEVLIDKLKKGENVALVSDAGTPGISDPGEIVIRKAIENGINVVPIPGACAMVNALIASGLNTKEFIFIGFLPVDKKDKEEKLKKIEYVKSTIILYEAPHKLAKTLVSINNVLGNRKIVLAKELTKIHEMFDRGYVEELIIKYEGKDIKGEFVIVIEGSQFDENDIQQLEYDKLSLEDHYKLYEKQGLEKKEIIKNIAKDKKVHKNEIYKKFL